MPPYDFQTVVPAADTDEISLVALLRTLARQKRKIVRVVAITTVVAVPVVFLIPIKYQAESVILTPQQAQSSLLAMAQLSGVAGGGLPLSLLSGFGLRNSSYLYVGVLESRTISDDLIKSFDLKRVYNYDNLRDTRKKLARNTTIESGKDSLIHIQVEDRDPRRAATLANAYVEELSKQNSRLTLSEATQRRIFFQAELAKEKDALADAEVQLKNTEKSTGLIVPGSQAEALIRSGAQLRGAILSREAQIAAMKTYATNDNPHLQIAERGLAAMQAQYDKLEKGNRANGILDLPTGQLPDASLEYVRKLRDVKYHEALFEILAKQYEAARLDEAKSTPVIQVVDYATVPEKKSWPPRTLLVLAAALLAGLITSFWIIVRSRWPISD